MAKKGKARPNARPAKPARKAKDTPAPARGRRPRGTAPAAPPPDDKKIPISQAMREAVEQLGERTIPAEAEVLQEQMNKLADLLEDRTRRQAACDSKADEYRTAKKSLESADELLRETVRSFTHAKPLPLFDAPQAESDRQRMLTAGKDGESD